MSLFGRKLLGNDFLQDRNENYIKAIKKNN